MKKIYFVAAGLGLAQLALLNTAAHAQDTSRVLNDVVVTGYGQTLRKGGASGVGEVAPRHFTSAVGDTKGKHTRIELTCHSCTVDFK